MSDKVLMKGNEALAEAAICAGCRNFFGYPITPQTEVAAINMVQGAAAAGIRAMTSSSSPGVSLKLEGISYMCGSDLPALIINVQRGGPGLGGIQPSQSDYNLATKAPGHGDLHVLVFAPSSVQEMVDLVGHAFDCADKYRMPAMILADGLLGQMMEPVKLPEKKLEPADLPEKDWAAKGHEGKRKHNIINSLYLKPQELEDVVKARYERYALIEKEEPMCEKYMTDDADFVIVAFGACARIGKSAINIARKKGIKVGLIRPITLWPFPKKELLEAADGVKAFLSVEMNMGQMVEDVRLAIECKKPVEFFGHTGGIIPTPAEIVEKLEKMQEEIK